MQVRGTPNVRLPALLARTTASGTIYRLDQKKSFNMSENLRREGKRMKFLNTLGITCYQLLILHVRNSNVHSVSCT